MKRKKNIFSLLPVVLLNGSLCLVSGCKDNPVPIYKYDPPKIEPLNIQIPSADVDWDKLKVPSFDFELDNHDFGKRTEQFDSLGGVENPMIKKMMDRESELSKMANDIKANSKNELDVTKKEIYQQALIFYNIEYPKRKNEEDVKFANHMADKGVFYFIAVREGYRSILIFNSELDKDTALAKATQIANSLNILNFFLYFSPTEGKYPAYTYTMALATYEAAIYWSHQEMGMDKNEADQFGMKIVEEKDVSNDIYLALYYNIFQFLQEQRPSMSKIDLHLFCESTAKKGVNAFSIYQHAYTFALDIRSLSLDSERDMFANEQMEAGQIDWEIYQKRYRYGEEVLNLGSDTEKDQYAREIGN